MLQFRRIRLKGKKYIINRQSFFVRARVLLCPFYSIKPKSTLYDYSVTFFLETH